MMRPLLAALLLASPAAAEPFCMPTADMSAFLARQFQETPVAAGLSGMDAPVLAQVFASPSGSFTLTVSGADGLTCVVMTGIGWVMVEGAPA